MREFVAVAFNTLFSMTDEGKLDPRAEVILISSVPKWGVDAGGMRATRIVQEERIMMSRHGMRQMVKAFTEQADMLDKIAEITDAVVIPAE